MDKSKESGRSMVEIIAVLALMGVLSGAGIAGYKFAINKKEANDIIDEINKRAVTASSQLISGAGVINLEEYGNHGAIRDYPVNSFYPYYENDDSYFALEVQNVPKGICDIIFKLDWETSYDIIINDNENNDSCSEADNNMTFVFHEMIGATGFDGGALDLGCRSNIQCLSRRRGSICDTETGECLPCRSDSDCTIPRYGLLCDRFTGLCKKCENNDDCTGDAAGEVCNTSTGKCVQCVTNDDCEGNPNGELCHKEAGLCVSCLIDSDCKDNNKWCNQVQHVCEDKTDAQIEDKYGTQHDCTTSRLLLLENPDDCSTVCPNRTLQYGYCAPVCADDEWLQIIENYGNENGQPQSQCLECSKQTGWHYGTVTSDFCTKCAERYYYTDSHGGEHMCALKECNESYFNCNNGCCACSSLTNQSIYIGTGSLGYSADNTSRVWGGYVYNGVISCNACSGEHARTVDGTSCYLTTCPTGTFRRGKDCVKCSSTSAYKISTNADITACLSCSERAINGQYCVLQSQCPNGYNTEERTCSECDSGTFPYQSQCISCDDPKWYRGLSKELCNTCPQREWITLLAAEEGLEAGCMLKAKKGQYYTTTGTYDCDTHDSKTQVEHCGMCNGSKILVSKYVGAPRDYGWCINPDKCPEGYFIGYDSSCKSCNYPDPVTLREIVRFNKNGNEISRGPEDCSTVCPGQRYESNGQCTKCPGGTYSEGANATTCAACPTDRSKLGKGACIACDGTWNNGKCQ